MTEAQLWLRSIQERSLRNYSSDLEASYQNSGIRFTVRDLTLFLEIDDEDALRSFWAQHGQSSRSTLDALRHHLATQRSTALLTLEDGAFSQRACEARALAQIEIEVGLRAGPLLEAGWHYSAKHGSVITVGVGVRRLRAWIHLLLRGLHWEQESDPRCRILAYLPLFAETFYGRLVAGIGSPLPDWAIAEVMEAEALPEYVARSAGAELFLILHEMGHVSLHTPGVATAESELAADRWGMERLLTMRTFDRDTAKSVVCLFLAQEQAFANRPPLEGYPSPDARVQAIMDVLAPVELCELDSVRAFVDRVRAASRRVKHLPRSEP